MSYVTVQEKNNNLMLWHLESVLDALNGRQRLQSKPKKKKRKKKQPTGITEGGVHTFCPFCQVLAVRNLWNTLGLSTSFRQPLVLPYSWYKCVMLNTMASARFWLLYTAALHRSSHAGLRRDTQLPKPKNKYLIFSPSFLCFSFYVPYSRIM